MANVKIKSLRLLLVSFLTIGSLCSTFHPYYVSVTEIKYNVKEKTLEISCKLFDDDIENALRKLNNVTIDVGAAKDSSQVHKLLAQYLAKHLQLTMDGQKVKTAFLGFEKEQDVIWCYLEATAIPDFKKLCIETTLLYDFVPEQINLVHVIRNNNTQSRKLNNPDARICFEF
jgi:hypothetical protein